MPIEVHCPNPDCARVHHVKNKYAGMRGKCPACASWMLVPSTGQMPSGVGLRPGNLEATTAWNQDEVVQAARGQASAPAAPPARVASPAPLSLRAALEEDPLPLHEDPEDHLVARAKARRRAGESGEPEAAGRKRFSGTAALLLVLGILALGAVAATPFLQVGEIAATEDFATDYGSWKLEGVKEENRIHVMGVPAGVAVMALLSLFAGLITGRSGFLSLLLVYVTTLLAAGLLFLVLFVFHEQAAKKQEFDDAVAKRKADGARGDASYPLGQYLWAGLGGASGASVFFLLAAMVMHRRTVNRMLGFLFLAGVTSLGAVWVYRTELGIEGFDKYLSF